MSQLAYSDRIMNRYVRRNFINGVYTLLGKKYLFYTLLVVIANVISIGAYFFMNFSNPSLLKGLLIFEVGLFFSFIITGILAFKVGSAVWRIIFIISFSIGFFLLFETILRDLWKVALDLQIISCLALICFGFLITFRNLNTSWIGRLWIIGKAVNTTAMRSVIRSVVIGLGISVIFVYLFLTPSPLELPNYYYLSVAILNGIASLLLTLIVYKESYYAKYLAHTFFVQALSMFYLFSLVPIMFIKFILNDISLPVYNFILIVFAIVALTQAFTMPRTEFEQKITSSSFLQRLQVGTPKKDFEEVKDIVIIDIEEGVKPEKIKPKKIEKKEPMTSNDGKMMILLGLIIPLQFLIINFYINPSVFIPIPFVEYPLITLPFSWGDLDFIISMIGLGIVIISILFYFGSKKVQDWYLNKIPLQAAFWEFLTLIERKERMAVLAEMGDVIRETLISGIMDFIDSAREDFQSTIYYGSEFFRRLFGIG